MVVRQDVVSYALMVFCILVSVEMFTRTSSIVVLFPAFLCVFGFVGDIYVSKLARKNSQSDYDNKIDRKERYGMIFWFLIAVAGSVLIAYAVDSVSALSLTSWDSLSNAFFTGVGEEQFFRAFLLDALLLLPAILSRFTHFGLIGGFIGMIAVLFQNGYVCAVVSAGIFTYYHLAHYGVSDVLIYVFGGGLLLSLSAFKLRRVSQCMLAHGAINLPSVLRLVFGGV